MISEFMGIEYGRGACAIPREGGVANAPAVVQKMFPNVNWTLVSPEPIDMATCIADRFGENAKIQRAIYDNTPSIRHIMIGGDHSVNFGHFAALADQKPDEDLCMVYVDAHLDIHTPESSRAQATGSPHGCNVRGLMGHGDARWLNIPKRVPLLKPENMFYIGARSFEPAEIEFAHSQNIFIRHPDKLQTMEMVRNAVAEIREHIAARNFVLSFDFDGIDPKYFPDVLVPADDGLSIDAATYIVDAFKDAYGIEFVEYAPNGNAGAEQIVHDLITIAMNQ